MVALLYVMLLVGMVAGALAFGAALENFTHTRLVQVVQSVALLTMVFNMIALWKQEARDPSRTSADAPRPEFRATWRRFIGGGRSSRLLVAVGLGTAAFSMQDILLEPYGGQVLHLSVAATTALTAVLAGGSLIGFTLAARALIHSVDPYRLAGAGAVIGLVAFAAVILAAPFESTVLFRVGTLLIGIGGGLFSVGTLTAAMALARDGHSGLALGAWGAVQATAAGAAIALGGATRDVVSSMAERSLLGPALTDPATGYGFVYLIEIGLLFATMVAVGPLVRPAGEVRQQSPARFGLAEFPG